ncbi:alpha/beta fold hydrolase [Microbispora sp. NPDC049125]|uniref:alpha/beta hydrolase n=1 Tax=Microbispora sp. NPDC049125 TaxID=3154929 RepID=UPI0034653F20
MRKVGGGVGVETDPAAIAAAVVEMMRNGRFADLEGLFAPSLRAVVSAGTLEVAWESQMSGIGAVSAVGPPIRESGAQAGLVRVSVPVTCERGGLTVVMSVGETGLLHGLRLAPALTGRWTPPPYAVPRRFGEHEVTVGSGELAVPGTLSVPRGRGPWPGVVLLSGGGPFDRDAASGPNKPLKDLAWGLAGRGVAVLRFDKVTCVHAGQVAARPDFTMTDEYVPHAVAAVRLLQRHPAVDAGRVYVAGHSMGGKVAPRVAVAEPSVAGLVLLAADSEPMHHAAVRVVRHLAAVSPGPAADAAVEAITRQAALVDSPGLSAATAASDLPFGYSGAYWLDLRGYDPVATAAASGKPMLILQGGRDYQVTVEDDLSRWRAGLAHRADVTIRVYDADDHMFFSGSGPSTPADYESPQHVDPAVVADIADWLAPRRGGMARLVSRLGRTFGIVFDGVRGPGIR